MSCGASVDWRNTFRNAIRERSCEREGRLVYREFYIITPLCRRVYIAAYNVAQPKWPWSPDVRLVGDEAQSSFTGGTRTTWFVFLEGLSTVLKLSLVLDPLSDKCAAHLGL